MPPHRGGRSVVLRHHHARHRAAPSRAPGSVGAQHSPHQGGSAVLAVNAGSDKLSACLERVTDAEKSLHQQLGSIQSVLADTRSMLTELQTAGLPAGTGWQQMEEMDANNDQPSAVQECAKSEADQGDLLVLPGGSEADTKISLSEQMAALEQLAPGIALSLGLTAAEVRKAYDLFVQADADSSGKLEMHELKPCLEAISDTVISEKDFGKILQEFDKNEDGQLNFEEFLFCYCHTPKKIVNHLEEWVYNSEHHNTHDWIHFRAKVVGVRASSIVSYLSSEIEQMQACLALPTVLLLFLLFMLSIEFHRGNYVIHGMEKAIKYDIEENANFAFSGVVPFENGRMGHKNIYDINTFADFWSWFDLGVTPLLFPESWDVSETRANTGAWCQKPVDALLSTGWTFKASVLSQVTASNTSSGLDTFCKDPGPAPVTPTDFFRKPPYLFFNSIVAGLRLSQEQVALKKCQDADLHLRVYDSKCLEDPGYWIAPDLNEALGMTESRLNKPNASTHYFLSQWNQTEVRRRAKDLENAAWLNQRTGKVELLFTTYNPHQNVFTALYINFFVNRGGHIYKFIKPVSVWVDPYQSIWSYLLDSAFALMVLKLFFEEARELVMNDCYKRGLGQGLRNYFSSFKNLMHWITILYSFLVFVMWGQQVLVLQELRTSLETGSTEVSGTWADRSDRLGHFELADRLTAHMQSFETAVAFYPLAIGARFISAFSGQQRLALVTDTLFAAAVDIIHFGVVMGSMILTYTVSAQILFGREVEGFETFGRAIITVFRGLLGDIDYEAIARVGRPAAGVWFVTFTVLLNLVMLNMLLAIVFDAYAKVKGGLSEDAETFWTQVREIFRRWRGLRMGKRITLEEVLIPLEASSADYFTASSLMKLVPNLKEAQAMRILSEADKISVEEDGVSEDLEEKMRTMNVRVQQIQLLLKQEGSYGLGSSQLHQTAAFISSRQHEEDSETVSV